MNVRCLLVALAIAASAAAADRGPLEAFDFLAGHCWRGEMEETASTDTHCFRWVYDGKHLRDVHTVRGTGPEYRGESIYSVDRTTGNVVYRYWTSQGGVSDGRVEFADGEIIAPGERYVGVDGEIREFTTVISRFGEDAYETRTRELVGDEWQDRSRVVFRRAGSATEEGSAARQQSERLSVFQPFIGEWQPHPDDPALAQRPDMRGKTAFALQWGPRRMYVAVREVYPSGEADQAVAQGLVYWDHLENRFDFVSSTAYGWIFEGSYRLLDDGTLERVYDVHYQDGEEYIPEPDIGGWTRRFRETYRLEDADHLKSTLELYRDGAWEPFGAGEYSMVKR